jgi:hypothetical protein
MGSGYVPPGFGWRIGGYNVLADGTKQQQRLCSTLVLLLRQVLCSPFCPTGRLLSHGGNTWRSDDLA